MSCAAAAFVKVLNKPLPAPYIEDPYETKQLLAKKELQVSGGWSCARRVTALERTRQHCAAGAHEESGGKARVYRDGNDALRRHAQHLQDEHQSMKGTACCAVRSWRAV
jgi:hypothetical protein